MNNKSKHSANTVQEVLEALLPGSAIIGNDVIIKIKGDGFPPGDLIRSIHAEIVECLEFALTQGGKVNEHFPCIIAKLIPFLFPSRIFNEKEEKDEE